ncbi:PLP-dependent aminotransferase family protein [Parasulfuritortus cantonensis]|uniref:PLP-dependent aminotransferase family protein n=2 Tax=Parasulfuritortus cantonensis TaxID=2528202 RepID=A0A4R1BDA1_9PROT|nr:PLP-dependent aminotransferase family protein [Parasulfuritortus cantonensis]
MNLYENLAAQLKDAIREGVYPPGERVPSVRRLSERHRVSQATVVAAYRLLESHGWLEARPQSGFYARQPESAPAPARPGAAAEGPCQVNVTERTLRMLRNTQRKDLVSFGAAVPQPEFLPLADLRASLKRCLRAAEDLGSRYSFPPGEEALRVRIARRAEDSGCRFGPDEIVVTDGCQEALNLALRAVARTGDIVAIESPAFFGTLQAIESLGMQALEIPGDPDTGISLEALALALDRWPVKAVMVVSNYSNPTGGLMPDANKARLVRLLAARGVPLIEDDIYGDLCHGRDRPLAAKAYDRDGNVLLCSSFTKSIAPGYRIGWIVPGRWQQTVEHLKYMSTMGNATLTQLAVADYLADSRYERHLGRVRRVYADNLARIQAGIARYFPYGTRASRPGGGFVLWVELPEGIDTEDLYERALAAGVSFTPGRLFSAQARYGNCLRLAAALTWDGRAEAALAELGRLAGRH